MTENARFQDAREGPYQGSSATRTFPKSALFRETGLFRQIRSARSPHEHAFDGFLRAVVSCYNMFKNNKMRFYGLCILHILFSNSSLRADCASCPDGVSAKKVVSRFAESLQSEDENIALVRHMPASEIAQADFLEFFMNKKVGSLARSGYSISIFQVIDKVKGDSKYFAYAATIGITTSEWNQGLTHFAPDDGSEWLIITGPSAVASEDIGGVRFIELPDEAAGIISAAADNKLGVNVRALLSDLKVLSRGTKLSGEKLHQLKTGVGQAIYERFQSNSH